MNDFAEPGSLAPTGLYLGGTKYMVIQGEPGAVIRGKKVMNSNPIFGFNLSTKFDVWTSKYQASLIMQLSYTLGGYELGTHLDHNLLLQSYFIYLGHWWLPWSQTLSLPAVRWVDFKQENICFCKIAFCISLSWMQLLFNHISDMSCIWEFFLIVVFFAGTWWCYCQEDQCSLNHWYLWWANDSRPVQHDCWKAWWLSHWSRSLITLDVMLFIAIFLAYKLAFAYLLLEQSNAVK